jgi:hypothetical protein
MDVLFNQRRLHGIWERIKNLQSLLKVLKVVDFHRSSLLQRTLAGVRHYGCCSLHEQRKLEHCDFPAAVVGFLVVLTVKLGLLLDETAAVVAADAAV